MTYIINEITKEDVEKGIREEVIECLDKFLKYLDGEDTSSISIVLSTTDISIDI